MKRFIKICLLTAAILVVCGIAVSIIGYALGAFRDIRSASTPENGKTEYIEYAAANISEVRIALSCENVAVSPSRDDSIHIEYTPRENIKYTHELKSSANDGKDILVFRSSNTHLGFSIFSIHFADEYQNAVRVSLPEGLHLQVETVSGEIDLNTLTAGNTVLSSTSGEISLTNLSADSLSLSSTSGDMECVGSRVTGDLRCSTTSGEIELEQVDVCGQKAVFGSVSGDIALTNSTVAGELTLSTTSGEVELEQTSAGQDISVGTVSGDVSLWLIGPRHRVDSIDTVSGEISVSGCDDSAPYGISVSTTSGEIEIIDNDGGQSGTAAAHQTASSHSSESHHDEVAVKPSTQKHLLQNRFF